MRGDFVVDTNVVVKFFIDESDSQKAAALLESFRSGSAHLITLDLLFMEFANVLWLKTVKGHLTRQQAEGKLARLAVLSSLMEVVPATAVLFESFQASCQLAHPAYGTAFLVLAESRAIPLITADEKFYKKVQPRYGQVLLLRHLQV